MNIKNLLLFVLICGELISITSCDKCNKVKTDNPVVEPAKNIVVNAPPFNSDSAYAYTQAQVDFGFRIPNTKEHDACAKWLTEKVKEYTDTVYVQKFDVTAWDNKRLHCTNIIASINPTAKKRILLTSHWDSRPWADQDKEDADKPFPSACDGASGVATLIEIARDIKMKKLNIGVDLFFTDAEDYGKSGNEDAYCLGTQYWANHPHVPDYKADFGILLDMAAARNAVFAREATSESYAGWVLDKVWRNAATVGYSGFFVDEEASPITDDHVYINKLRNIPTIDIIHYDRNNPGFFASYWHTHKDNMDIIDKTTLQAVGKTLLYTIYQYDAEQTAQ